MSAETLPTTARLLPTRLGERLGAAAGPARGPAGLVGRALEVGACLHESGTAAPSTTVIGGRLAIRAAIVNHRTAPRDIDALLDAVVAFGAADTASRAA